MILPFFILLTLAGGIIAAVLGRFNTAWPRRVSVVVLVADLALAVLFWAASYGPLLAGGNWIAEFHIPWVPALGIGLDMAMDGLGLLLVLLTFFLGLAAAGTAWHELRHPGFFHLCLLWTLAGVVGVFLALDLVLFYFFWELMLIPMFFLIAIWGHENRGYASIKFFIFTQVSGLLMLASILGLFFVHGSETGNFTFYFPELIGSRMDPVVSFLLMLGFAAAFAVKLPVFPFHPWLPDAHTEAPTAGSVILAGLLLKTGAYGFLRFALPLFPESSLALSPMAIFLGIIGILYGAMMAYSQDDIKRLVAFTSVSHMGFVLLGIYIGTAIALQGAILQIICHGLSTGALFIIAGALQDRIGTRELDKMGGLWSSMPRLGGFALFFALASMGLPGIGNFVAEFLILLGTFEVNTTAAILGSLGFVLSTVYSLNMMRRVFFGPSRPPGVSVHADLSRREALILVPMILLLLWFGFYPQPLFKTTGPGIAVSSGRPATNAAKGILSLYRTPIRGVAK